MRRIVRLVEATLALTLLASATLAQEARQEITPTPTSLPTAWHGVWHGEMRNTGKSGKTAKVPVVFEVLPIEDSRDVIWRKTYGEGERKVVKDYRLVPRAKQSDRFGIDEQNGIVLDLRKVGNVMHGCFRIGERVYTSRYELRDGALSFEITVAEPNGDEQEHGVQDYTTTVVQAARLSRKGK